MARISGNLVKTSEADISVGFACQTCHVVQY